MACDQTKNRIIELNRIDRFPQLQSCNACLSMCAVKRRKAYIDSRTTVRIPKKTTSRLSNDARISPSGMLTPAPSSGSCTLRDNESDEPNDPDDPGEPSDNCGDYGHPDYMDDDGGPSSPGDFNQSSCGAHDSEHSSDDVFMLVLDFAVRFSLSWAGVPPAPGGCVGRSS